MVVDADRDDKPCRPGGLNVEILWITQAPAHYQPTCYPPQPTQLSAQPPDDFCRILLRILLWEAYT